MVKTSAPNLLTFRGNPREKRTKKQKGKVVNFSVKPKPEHEVELAPIHLIHHGKTWLVGNCPTSMINELCSFLRTICNEPLSHYANGSPRTGQLIFRYGDKEYLFRGYPEKQMEKLCNLADSLETDSNTS
jgi:hypothetical protein